MSANVTNDQCHLSAMLLNKYGATGFPKKKKGPDCELNSFIF